MQKVAVLGAGKSSGSLISYLAQRRHLDLLVADYDQVNVVSKTKAYPHVRTFCGDVAHPEVLEDLVRQADVVVSLLPPHLHIEVAKICLTNRKHLLTASYASKEILQFDREAKEKETLILMECGLDPGIDHMSALQVIHRLRSEGARITSFQSYCGGLVAPESDDNPWGYKITWNPRNVVLAGQGTAQYLERTKIKLIPYQQLFKRYRPLYFDSFGEYEAYPNRDSLSYIPLYQLEEAETFIRGTIRKKGYCKAWDCLVQLGLTDTVAHLVNPSKISMKALVESLLPEEVGLVQYLGLAEDTEVLHKLLWLGLEEESRLIDPNVQSATPAEFLQKLIEWKWELKPGDKDLVLMQHLFEYELEGRKNLVSSLVQRGGEHGETAMAKTVGLPLAIATELVASGQIGLTGVQRPVIQEIYEPILKTLKHEGIIFREYVYS